MACCLWLHVAMETKHGLFMVNDLVIDCIYALGHCAGVIYTLMEGSPRRGVLFLLTVPWEMERTSAPKTREEEKKEVKQTKINDKSF